MVAKTKFNLVTGGALLGRVFEKLEGTRDHVERLPNGALLGPYEVLEEIGAGGGGTVYRARRYDGTFEQQVALKVVKASALMRDRARMECDLLASLTHPAVPRIFDAGSLPSGELWFAMELVDGQSIDSHCDRENIGFRARVELLAEVCDGVEHAHARGIVHRDLKPSNILVSDTGHPKIIDFGIAFRSNSDEPYGDSLATFTPGFASPEQLSNQAVTAATDIYQLGLVIENLLRGVRRSENRIVQRLDAANLNAIVACATAPNVTERYANAGLLAQDLRALIAGEPVQARTWSSVAKLFYFAVRNRSVLAAMGGLLLVGTGSLLWSEVRLDQANIAATAADARADSVADFIDKLISQADPSLNIGDNLSAIATLDAAARQLTAPDVNLPPAEKFRLANRIATLYYEINELDRVVSLSEHLLKDISSESRPTADQLRFMMVLAHPLFASSHEDQMLRYLNFVDRAIPKFEGSVRDELRARYLLVVGLQQVSHQQTESGKKSLDEAWQIVERLNLGENELTFFATSVLAKGALYSSPQDAVSFAERSADIALTLYGRGHRYVVQSQSLHAYALARVGRVEEALLLMQKVKSMALKLPTREGVNHQLIHFSEMTRASIARRASKFDTCLEAADASLFHFEQQTVNFKRQSVKGSNTPVWVFATRARCLMALNRTSDAIKDYRSSLHYQKLQQRLDVRNPVADVLSELLVAYRKVGNMAGADKAIDDFGEMAEGESANAVSMVKYYLEVARVKSSNNKPAVARLALSKARALTAKTDWKDRALTKEIDVLDATLASNSNTD